ncbi:uncharacterized protein LOC108195107 isoform X3 [Daucus carota subsp. sativus]|nr:PREDICTED: uncharacterized protein LOC108195107 isoform X1 [Daucus carota subsp. sativus]XP_017217542.1 PREDICTED: uncharacterized protein LOC108195107 isoform X1 [Daucus carota subsp. sativus]
MMTRPSNERLPGLQRPQYQTRSRYRENPRNDCHGITTCSQELTIEEIHMHSVKIKDLRSCFLATTANVVTSTFFIPLGVQNTDNMQNIQKSAPSMCKDRDVNFRNVRKSPRLSVQKGTEKHVIESDQEGVKCRLNSQNKLCFPAEIISANLQQSKDRNFEFEGKMNLPDVRRSPRLSEGAREIRTQILFESTEKITSCRKKSRMQDLNQEKFSPAEAKFVDKIQRQNEISNDEGVADVQNTRTLPRVSAKDLGIGLQSIVDFSDRGVFTHESHIKRTYKSNLSSETTAAPANMPHILNTSGSCNGIMNSQSRRKSVRLSSKNGEMDLQKNNLPGEYSFSSDMELTTVTQVWIKSSDCNQRTDLESIQKSVRLSCRSKETDMNSSIICSEEMRTEPQKNGSDSNILPAVKFDNHQVQNVSANSGGHVDLKKMQKSPHLSGMKRQKHLQLHSRKEVKLGTESQKKGCHGNNRFLPSKLGLTDAPSVQNQTVGANKEEINLGEKSQKKGFDGSTRSPRIELELTTAPSLHNESVEAARCLLNKADGSPLNSPKSIPTFQYYVGSGRGINLIVDLNSSPSDWTKKIFETSSSSQSLQKNKFESFRHEIESLRSKIMISSLISNPFNKISPGHLHNDAYPESVSGEACPLQSDIPERGNGSSDITDTNSFIDIRTRDGQIENSSGLNTETFGDHIASSQEFQETTITIYETKASEQSSNRSGDAVPDDSHKRKKQGRKICGIRLKSGKHLGSRKSMRLWHQGGPL